MKSLFSFFTKDNSIPFEEEILAAIQAENIDGLRDIFESKSINPALLTKVTTN